MAIDSQLLFRRVWMTNGILLLLVLLGTVGIAGYGLLSGLWSSDHHGVRPSSTATDSAQLRARAVRYDPPEDILGTDWMLLRVRYGKDYGKEATSFRLGSAYEGGYGDAGPLVNVAFLRPTGGPGRLLLVRPAFIQQVQFPPERPRYSGERIDSVPWITYSIVFEDTDGSGRLDGDDAAELYISDLDGSGFRRVLPPGLRVRSTSVLPGRRLLVMALDARGDKKRPEDQLPQRAFRYTPSTGELNSDIMLDSLAVSAGRILGRP